MTNARSASMEDWAHWDLLAQSASVSIAGRIARLIRDGRLGPGDRLPGERDIASRLRVSRTTVRDALRELELRGMVSRRPGRGTVVENIPRPQVHAGLLGTLGGSERVLREVMDLRAAIEPPIAERAALRATEDQIGELCDLLEQATAEYQRSITPERYTELDIAFHACLGRMTQNPMLDRLLTMCQAWMSPSRLPTLESDQRIRSSLSAHRAIVAAIEEHNAGAARDEMSRHIEEILFVITQENAG